MPDQTFGVMLGLTMAQKQQNQLPWTRTSEAMRRTSIMFSYVVVHAGLELGTSLSLPPESWDWICQNNQQPFIRVGYFFQIFLKAMKSASTVYTNLPIKPFGESILFLGN